VVTVVCDLLWILLNLLMGYSVAGAGANVGGYGLIAAFGLLFRGQRFFALFGTIEAQHIAIGLVAIGVILSLPAHHPRLGWSTGRLRVRQGALGPAGQADRSFRPATFRLQRTIR
jgi:hypothetical protein